MSHLRPTFIGIGAQKAATSWCYEALAEHPQVEMAWPKELNYFSDEHHRGHAWYESRWSDDHKPARGEISPLYMDHPEVADRIADRYPDATILVVLRDPWDRAVSNLLHAAQGLRGGVSDLGVGQLREVARSSDMYVRRSRYAAALGPYFERFPRERLKVLFYERLRSKPEAFASELFGAIGVDRGFIPSACQRTVNKSIDYRPKFVFKALREVSQAAKRWGPTRAARQWVCHNTRLQAWTLSQLESDRGRPRVRFADLFTPSDSDSLRADVAELASRYSVAPPESWGDRVESTAPAHAAA